MQNTSYTGTSTLEILREAVNYNRFLEKELVQFIQPETTAIDFGAGNGEFSFRLRMRNIQVTAIESDTSMVKKMKVSGLNVHAQLADAPLHARLYSLNVLEHIEDDTQALCNIAATLTTGGQCFLYVPAFMALMSDFDRTIGHFRRYHKKELIEKCEEAGLRVIRAEYVDSIGFMCWWLMSALPNQKSALNQHFITLFDQALFPLSRICDRICKHFFGKNLLVIAYKAA